MRSFFGLCLLIVSCGTASGQSSFQAGSYARDAHLAHQKLLTELFVPLVTDGATRDSNYLPLAAGNIWRSRVTDGDPFMGWPMKYQVYDSIRIGQYTYWRCDIFRLVDFFVVDTVRQDTSGTLWWLHGGVEDPLVQFTAAPGDTWSYSDPIQWDWERRVVTYVGQLDSVKLPEGPLDSITFRHVKVFTSDHPGYYDLWEDSYFAPGVGRILCRFPQVYEVLYGVSLDGVTIGDTTTTSVSECNGLAQDFRLEQNYPNPFNPTTTIKLHLPVSTVISLKVYDIVGREIATLLTGQFSPGVHIVVWNAQGLASGIYFCRLLDGKHSLTSKMVLSK